ncbi:MAG: hemolysin III family protein, partial [Actinomycetota bacterium]|nr:hemolysin III family protein [Actinomycetota bacterium]
VAAWLLGSSAAGGGRRVSVVVFGACLVGLYATSSLYHVGSWSVRARELLSRCDGAMIPLFIAGTFTPVAFHALHGDWRTWSLVAAWTVAAVGAAVAGSPLRAPRWLGTAGYIAVGWLAVVPLAKITAALSPEGSGLIVLGGLLYTLGGVVFARRRPDPAPSWFGYHEVFHLLVVAATSAHYLAIWRYVLPMR